MPAGCIYPATWNLGDSCPVQESPSLLMTYVPCWIQMITGGGGKGLDFLSNFGFWVSFLFFATKLSIELFTLVKFSIQKNYQ